MIQQNNNNNNNNKIDYEFDYKRCWYCGTKHTYRLPISLYYTWNCDQCNKYNELIPSKKFLKMINNNNNTSTSTRRLVSIQCRECNEIVQVTQGHYDNCLEFDILMCPECLERIRVEVEGE